MLPQRKPSQIANIMTETTQDKIKAIKRRFRLMMNGEASRSMREKGFRFCALILMSKMGWRYMGEYPGSRSWPG